MGDSSVMARSKEAMQLPVKEPIGGSIPSGPANEGE